MVEPPVVRQFVRRWGCRMLLAAAALVLPFFVLLRGAMWLYGGVGLGTWPALILGALLTFLLLALYAIVVTRWLGRRVGRPARTASGTGVPKRLLQGVAILVVAYCVYGLAFLSGSNARSDAVRAEYRSLHPLLRMAVGTLVVVDGSLLVTDAGRVLADYAAMGLPTNERSLHYELADGWAHALDLQTGGRSELRNGLTWIYFRALGFRTLRHVGTGDHLHVSLPLAGR